MHHGREDSDEYRRNFWAFDQISRLCVDDPEACWQVIHAIRLLDSSDRILSNLAAGPLEDLLVAHGESFIGRIEELALQDARFRKLLSGIWRNKISEGVWARLRALAGNGGSQA